MFKVWDYPFLNIISQRKSEIHEKWSCSAANFIHVIWNMHSFKKTVLMNNVVDVTF